MPRPRWFPFFGVCFAIVAGTLLVTVVGVTKVWSGEPKTVTAIGTFHATEVGVMVKYADAGGMQITSGKYDAALTAALAAWKRELGSMPIARPTLFLGRGMCQGDLACASRLTNQIFIVGESIATVDETSVLMHEIGHLLGVPHIEGDDLMAPMYHAKVTKPTRFAVALAKASRKSQKP